MDLFLHQLLSRGSIFHNQSSDVVLRGTKMKKLLLSCATLVLLSANIASANLIIDNSTSGYYNQSIGTSLNLTNPYAGTYLFPGDYQTYGDPTFNPVPFAPDLSTASAALGNWLTTPSNLNSNWSFGLIPQTWPINDETAIVYRINAGVTGLTNVNVQLGVDNGIFVWLDGTFLNGWLAPGGTYPNEYSINIGTMSAGNHYLQILREDHGGSDGYAINVTGDTAPVPEPATMLLFGTGIAGLAAVGRRKRN